MLFRLRPFVVLKPESSIARRVKRGEPTHGPSRFAVAASDEIGKQSDAEAGRAFGQIGLDAFGPRRAGDVEMRPGGFASEVLQEPCGGDGAGDAVADVADVGD